jgi:hypothetical protein
MLHFFIYSADILTEYFKNSAYSPFFPLQNVVYFYNATFFGSCIIHILYTECAKIKKKKSGAKGLIHLTCLVFEQSNGFLCSAAFWAVAAGDVEELNVLQHFVWRI